MLNKKILHFENKSEFEKVASEIKEFSIVFIKDAKEIYTHGNTYNYVNWGILGEMEPTESHQVFLAADGEFLVSSGEEIYVLITK